MKQPDPWDACAAPRWDVSEGKAALESQNILSLKAPARTIKVHPILADTIQL